MFEPARESIGACRRLCSGQFSCLFDDETDDGLERAQATPLVPQALHVGWDVSSACEVGDGHVGR